MRFSRNSLVFERPFHGEEKGWFAMVFTMDKERKRKNEHERNRDERNTEPDEGEGGGEGLKGVAGERRALQQ